MTIIRDLAYARFRCKCCHRVSAKYSMVGDKRICVNCLKSGVLLVKFKLKDSNFITRLISATVAGYE